MQTARHYGDVSSIIYETGVDVLDDDHRKLVGQVLEINHFIDNLDHQNFSLELVYQIGELCERLKQSTIEHFKREEAIIRAHHLPVLTDHSKKHESILEELDDIIEELAKGKLTVTHDLKLAVLDWVIVHINQEDAKVFSVDSFRPALMKSRDPVEVKEMFLPVGIPDLDEKHKEFHRRLLNPVATREEWKSLGESFEEFVAIEENLMERWPIPNKAQHMQHHRSLRQLISQGQGHPERLLEALRRQVLIRWCSHHNEDHVGALSAEVWLANHLLSTRRAAELDRLVPPLKDEELAQARGFANRQIYKLFNLFSRLEVDLENQGLMKEFFKAQKKLRGHLRFQFELEEDSMGVAASEDKEKHVKAHKDLLSSIDFWNVLMQSDQMEMASAARRKLLGSWLHHMMFFDQKDLQGEVDVG
jgi:hemerythrin-like metal-binding protein